jgi:formylglycine-generating enzyme required for sulfatase activity
MRFIASSALLALALGACAPAAVASRPGDVRVNAIGMRLVTVPAGSFGRGSAPGEDGRFDNEGPVRTIAMSRAFEIGVHEVTNGQFRAFVEATGYVTEAERDAAGGFGIDFETARVIQESGTDWRSPGFPGFEPGDDHPVLLVSWDDAEAFCRWLSATEGRTYRLPTETEWEYAARGGTSTPWWTGGDPAQLARAGNLADASLAAALPAADWCAEWDDGFPFLAPVGSFAANPFGLHDVHGNVWEWCSDWYGSDSYARGPDADPTGPASGAFRTIRGGGWFNPPRQQRSAQRIYFHPTFRYCLLSGFRVVCELG